MHLHAVADVVQDRPAGAGAWVDSRLYGGLADKFFNVIVMNAFLSFPGILLGNCVCAFLGRESST